MSAYIPAKPATFLELRKLMRPSPPLVVGLVFIAAIGWAGLVVLPARLGANAMLVRMESTTSDHPDLVLLSARAERKYEFVTVVGSATNVSSRDLRNVEAVVELLDGAGNVLRLEIGSDRSGEA